VTSICSEEAFCRYCSFNLDIKISIRSILLLLEH
jgi:hypothetical protein